MARGVQGPHQGMRATRVVSVRLPATTCPTCRETLDGVTSTGSRAQPEPGDYSICVYCGTLLMFTETLVLRRLTYDEERAVPLYVKRKVEIANRAARAWNAMKN